MRGLLGLVSLVLALGVVGLLVRQQIKAVKAPLPVLQTPAGAGATPSNAPVPAVPQQVQQQYKQALEGAMQARPMPDEK